MGANALFSSRSGGKRWIDQTPYYVFMTEVLVRMFPGLFLHVLRDGRNVGPLDCRLLQLLGHGYLCGVRESWRVAGMGYRFPTSLPRMANFGRDRNGVLRCTSGCLPDGQP